MLGRTLRVHDVGNAAVRTLLDRIAADLAGLRETESALAFVFAEGHAFVNGVWVRATRQSWDASMLFTQRLRMMKARGLVSEPTAREATILGLGRALRPETDPAGVDALAGVRLLPEPERADEVATRRAEQRNAAAELFREGLRTTDRAKVTQLDLDTRRRQRSLVTSLVQLAEDGFEDLLALTTLRDPKVAGAAHDLMVTIYSICIGRALDLPRRDLLRLGVAALGHNLGEAFIDPGVFGVPRELTPEERASVSRHPLLGFVHLLSAYGFTPGSIDRAVVALEHHVHADGEGGYPIGGDRPHEFARIVAVADVFDALCSDRPHRPGRPPDQAMKMLLRSTDGHLDPVLVRALVRVVGRFPPGSCVELDTGETGIVIAPGAGWTPLDRPRVLLITDEDGFRLPTPTAVDLGERHASRRAWLRTIARTRDPRRLGVPVSSLVFGPRVEAEPQRIDRDVMPPPKARAVAAD